MTLQLAIAMCGAMGRTTVPAVAFSCEEGDVPEIRISSSKGTRHFENRALFLQQYSRSLNTFVLLPWDTDVLFTWVPGGNPKPLVDLRKLIPALKFANGDRYCSISPNGQSCAVLTTATLWVINLKTHAVQWLWGQHVKLGFTDDWRNDTAGSGVCWNSKGTAIAASIPGANYDDGDSSSVWSHPICTVFQLDGKVRKLGEGAPVAWVGDQIVCSIPYEKYMRKIRIYDLKRNRMETWHKVGIAVAASASGCYLVQWSHIVRYRPDKETVTEVWKVPSLRVTGNTDPRPTFVAVDSEDWSKR